MSSTRNKNCQGDYSLEQTAYTNNLAYNNYQGYGTNDTTHLPGNGLLAGKLHNSLLSYNNYDIESDLYGIGSTNLVSPKDKPQVQLKSLNFLSISDRMNMIMPEPLVVKKHERPFFG